MLVFNTYGQFIYIVAVCPNMANLNETSGVLTSPYYQEVILPVRVVVGKLQQVKGNALCLSLKR